MIGSLYKRSMIHTARWDITLIPTWFFRVCITPDTIHTTTIRVSTVIVIPYTFFTIPAQALCWLFILLQTESYRNNSVSSKNVSKKDSHKLNLTFKKDERTTLCTWWVATDTPICVNILSTLEFINIPFIQLAHDLQNVDRSCIFNVRLYILNYLVKSRCSLQLFVGLKVHCFWMNFNLILHVSIKKKLTHLGCTRVDEGYSRTISDKWNHP